MNKTPSKFEDIKAQLQSGRKHLGYYVLDRDSVLWLVEEVERLREKEKELC